MFTNPLWVPRSSLNNFSKGKTSYAPKVVCLICEEYVCTRGEWSILDVLDINSLHFVQFWCGSLGGEQTETFCCIFYCAPSVRECVRASVVRACEHVCVRSE